MAEIIRIFAENPELVIAFVVTPILGFVLLLIVVWRIIKDVIANSSLKSFTDKLFDFFKEISQDIKNLHTSISENVQQNKEEFGKSNTLINKTAIDTIEALGVNTGAIIDFRKQAKELLEEQQKELKELSQNVKDGKRLLLEKSDMQTGKIEELDEKVSKILETVDKVVLTDTQVRGIVNAVIEEMIKRGLIQAPPPPPIPIEE